MFGVLRAMLRSFVVGLAVGVLIAPRSGAETRRLLAARAARVLDQIRENAALLPQVPPERARTNGHAERSAAKRTRASTDARASS